jgi:hypothetical protein
MGFCRSSRRLVGFDCFSERNEEFCHAPEKDSSGHLDLPPPRQIG